MYRACYFDLYDYAKAHTSKDSGVMTSFAIAQVTTALAGLGVYRAYRETTL